MSLYKFLLIPPEGDSVPSLLSYQNAEQARATGEAMADCIVNPDVRALMLEGLRPDLALLAMTDPGQLEVVVIDLETRESVFPPRMITA